MRRILTALLLAASLLANAQIPDDYYNNASGKTGDELKVALHNIIKGHTTISYPQIWNAFWSTDNKGDGIVWDMYSDIPGGTPPYTYQLGEGQCGEYNSEGDCFNREHSWPQNWCNDGTAKTDLHHIFPTDGFVNGQRSNHPFGEVRSASWTSQNSSKLGTCKSSLGYDGTVFESIDAYKGDFARTLMYMSVRYYSEDSNWGTSDMTNKSEFLPWAIAMLMDWNEQDPVSQKEIDRNNAIYDDYQHNRNPFIDHPEYARMIWDENWQGGGSSGSNTGDGDYVKVTATPEDWSGEYLLVYEQSSTTGYIWTGVDGTNCYVSKTISNNTIADDDFITITIAPMTGGYSIKVNGGTNDGKYIYGKSNDNKILFGTDPQLNTIEYEANSIIITSNTSVLRYNTSATVFRYYKSSTYTNQQPVQLYKKTEPQAVEQSITLNAGWNWWSTCLDITLEQLEEALGSAGIGISSQNDGFVGNYSGTWTGGLQRITPSNMYKIQLNEEITITLNGTSVDPADYPITLNEGSNWIGYPVSQSMSLNEAFAGANPVNGDMVSSYNGSSQYYNGAWYGNLNTLEPGQGYIYDSKASTVKTLVFPSNDQKQLPNR